MIDKEKIKILVEAYLETWQNQDYYKLASLTTFTYQNTNKREKVVAEMMSIHSTLLIKDAEIKSIEINPKSLEVLEANTIFPSGTVADIKIGCKLLINDTRKLPKDTRKILNLKYGLKGTMNLSIILRGIKEKRAYKASIDGIWGIYPLSVYRMERG